MNPTSEHIPVLHPQQPRLEDPRGGPGDAGAAGGREARARERGGGPGGARAGAGRAGAAGAAGRGRPLAQVIRDPATRHIDARITPKLDFVIYTRFFYTEHSFNAFAKFLENNDNVKVLLSSKSNEDNNFESVFLSYRQ